MMNAAQIKHRGGPAFPISKEVEAFGMSLEDYFAGQAMATLLLGDPPAKAVSTERAPAQEIAKQAYKYAEAMLEERGQRASRR